MDNNTIESTTDYGKFSFIGTNRDTTELHLNTIRKAFQENGNITAINPILVNEHNQIIDGQHRFTICEEMGLPVYYRTVSGLGIDNARRMNIVQKRWDMADFAHSYAKEGNTNYIEYLKLKEDYGFSPSVMLACITNGQKKGSLAEFRRGEFELNDIDGARTRLDLLTAIYPLVPSVPFGQPDFAYSLLRLSKSENFLRERMIVKLAAHGSLMRRYASTEEYSRALEDLYNRGNPNRTRLY